MAYPVIIFFFTGNVNKIRRIKPVLQDAGFTVVTVYDLKFEHLEVEENKSTFAENALLKAQSAAAHFRGQLEARYPGQRIWVLAEDSGIVVPGLAGAFGLNEFPGVRSKRWCPGPQWMRSDLLMKMTPLKEHEAQLITAMALIAIEGYTIGVCMGQTECVILERASKTPGWGYGDVIAPATVPSRPRSEFSEKEWGQFCQRTKAAKELLAIIEQQYGWLQQKAS